MRNVLIDDNRIAVNEVGAAATVANTGSGIYFDSNPRDNLDAGNIISGNGSHCVAPVNASARVNLIPKTTPEPTTTMQIWVTQVRASTSAEGADDTGAQANTIAHNGGDGVTITGSGTTGNTVRENSFHDNDGQDIDLGDDGATANDTNDGDTGPNHLRDYQTNASCASRGDVASVRFSLDATRTGVYRVDYCSCDAFGSGEGKQWLGYSPVRRSTKGSPTFAPSAIKRSSGKFAALCDTHITATETGSISGLAPCRARATGIGHILCGGRCHRGQHRYIHGQVERLAIGRRNGHLDLRQHG